MNNITNIFIVNKSELEYRFDPNYLKIKKEIVSNFKFSLEKIGHSFIIKDGDHDKLPENAISNAEEGRRYLRAQDLKDDKIIDDKPIYITEDYFNKIKRCHIYPGDLLLSIMASVGAASIVPADFPICTANRAIGILRNKPNSKFSTEYLQILINTSVGLSLFEIEKKGGIQQRLNLSDIANVNLPCPDFEIQKDIITIYKKAYNEKQQKEVKAKSLLASIDAYLLDELEIKLTKRDNSYSNRVFKVKWSELSGDRFDAFSFFNNAIKIESGIYKNYKLNELATINKGQSITSSNVEEGQYPVIAGGKTSPYSHNVYNYEGKTITISASGAYSGYVWYHNERIFASDCTVIKSKDENVISMDYLSEILKLKQSEIYGLQQGAGQPHVYPSDLVKLNIPLPPLEIQERIISHIFELRERAKVLELDAQNILKNAKTEIEKMILG